ncbi:MAG TPA: hypothetical protein VMT64_04630, partial [Candidatus Binataceae bacterium]|nr:hypothetical protein [Candidatus Binataceae bacterium]
TEPNLASYSPTQAARFADADAALARLADPDFDPMRAALVTADVAWPKDAVPALPARLTFTRGGFKLEAKSPGPSVIVLPLQFSHCLASRVTAGDPDAHLIRVDLALTGLVFRREVAMDVQYRRWPRGSVACQAADYNEASALIKPNASLAGPTRDRLHPPAP